MKYSITPVLVGIVIITVLSVQADPIPTPLRHQIERSRASNINIPLRRGEYVDLQLQYFDYNEAVHLYGVQGLYFVINSETVTNSYPARIIDATNGIVGFMITPTNLWASNSYTWELPICGASSVTIRAFGTLSVTPSIGYQNLTNTPPPRETLDMALMILYNAGLAPWPLYAHFTSGLANLDISNLTVRGTVSGFDGGNIVGRDGAPGITPTITITNSLIGELGVTNLGDSTNLILRFTLPAAGSGGSGGGGGSTFTNITIIYNNSTNIAIAMTVSTNLIFSSNTNLIQYLYVSNWISTNLWLTLTNTIQGLTNMPALWDADTIGTNALYVAVGGQVMERHDSNGITMLHGSLQLYDEDLNCNVRLYDGSRQAPSLTFLGHTNEWGLYGRGYGGHQVAGWSVGSTEIGLLHAAGIKLVSTNSAFEGTCIGNLSGCWGYPEPLFTSWNTNMSFSALTLSNLVVTPGIISLKDTLNTTRTTVDTTGLTIRDAGGTTRASVNTTLTIKDSLGRSTLIVGPIGLATYDASSGMPLIKIGTYSSDTISSMTSAGFYYYQLSALGGLQLWDPYQTTYRASFNYQQFLMMDASSNITFRVDGTNGACFVRGQDTDVRYARATSGMTAFILTNVFAGVTQRVWYTASGVVTNHVP